MSDGDDAVRAALLHYLQWARKAVVWKLDGLSDYDARRPLVPTGTNVLGLVKHLAGMELAYFCIVLGRPLPVARDWLREDAPVNSDMWATPEESIEEIVGLYRLANAETDGVVAERALDSPVVVPWWGDAGRVTLHTVLVHVIAETSRHAGHADLVRELIDGAAGVSSGGSNLPDEGAAWWAAYRAEVQAAADRFR